MFSYDPGRCGIASGHSVIGGIGVDVLVSWLAGFCLLMGSRRLENDSCLQAKSRLSSEFAGRVRSLPLVPVWLP